MIYRLNHYFESLPNRLYPWRWWVIILNVFLKPVLATIDEAIQKVGNERGFDFIFDAMSGAILYTLDSHNLTEQVLDELSKNTGSVKE